MGKAKKVDYNGIIKRLRNGNYKRKIIRCGYANEGLQLQDHDKLARVLGICNGKILESLLKVKIIDRCGWNLPEDITPEMITKNLSILKRYVKI